MIINTNINSLNAHRALTSVGGRVSEASARLSSGVRVNSAADDAAGLAISEKMRAQIRGLNRAAINSQEGINLLRVADGALSQSADMIQRMRELAVQAANDTNSLDDRLKIQKYIPERLI